MEIQYRETGTANAKENPEDLMTPISGLDGEIKM
jgi:hypothetical protein